MEAVHRPLFLLAVAMSLLSAPMLAQEPGDVTPGIGNLMQTYWTVAGKVTTMQGDPVPGAKVAVQPSAGGEFRILILTSNQQGEFRTDILLRTNLVSELSVALTVTKKGFLKAHAIVDLGSPTKPWIIPITLREPKEDPALLSQASLISSLGPRLRKIDGLSAKGEKDYARGAEEFLDRKRADRSLRYFTRVIRRDPACLQCRTLRALAELDSGDWDGAYGDLNEAVRQGRENPKAGRAEPVVALGVMESWRQQLERAEGFLAEALRFAPDDALALQEMGRVESLLHNSDVAALYLAKAVQAGAGPEARLLRAGTLVSSGNFDEANKEMTLYLNGRDVRSLPLRARQIWAQIESGKKIQATYAKAQSSLSQPIDYLRRKVPELHGLEPAADQKPLEPILTAVGKDVQEFFQNFQNTASLERIQQERLGRHEKVQETVHSKGRYLCLIRHEAWGPELEEYRANKGGTQGGLHGLFMVTSGFVSVSLIFHPAYQPQTTFRYLGRQKIDGRNMHVIAFAQQPTKSRLRGAFKMGQVYRTTFSQGLAWVDPETYQIVRMRTDLLKPLAGVKLKRLTTEIDYGEVHFKHIAQGVWLPQQVTVTMAWNGKHLRNQHQYSDFKLFNVESIEKIGKPKKTARTSGLAGDSDAAQ